MPVLVGIQAKLKAVYLNPDLLSRFLCPCLCPCPNTENVMPMDCFDHEKMEAYNLTNSFIGAMPNVNVDSSLFGRVTAQRAGYYGRQLQYTGRIRW